MRKNQNVAKVMEDSVIATTPLERGLLSLVETSRGRLAGHTQEALKCAFLPLDRIGPLDRKATVIVVPPLISAAALFTEQARSSDLF